MKEEIQAAVIFLVRLIGNSNNLSEDNLNQFKENLMDLLTKKYENHWFPEKPNKGQAYRCIRVNESDRRDSILEKACKKSGMVYSDLKMPVELTLWVDPEEVTCRFGEHRGSYCMIATFKDGNKENYIDKINVDAIEKEYLEKAKQASYEIMNARRKRASKNGYHKNNYQSQNVLSSSGHYSSSDFSIPMTTVSSSLNYYSSHNNYFVNSTKFGPYFGSSPPNQSAHSASTHNSHSLFTANYHQSISPPNRSLNGTPYRGPNNYVNASISNSSINSQSPGYVGKQFSRSLQTALNNAALPSDNYQSVSDRYHWMNKSIVKA